MNFWFQIIFAWVKRFSELFDGSTNDADMRLSLALAIKANKVSLFCNQDNKTTAIEGIIFMLIRALLIVTFQGVHLEIK